ncbi:MAG: SpoIIE family protein phosphatase [Deltaproteobacteria bacterium]|nr:SpoIIE family protein phosphatase [Deltaproteobacteria bacterium]
MARLIATSGATAGTDFPLGDVCVLGRSRACNIYIGEPTVSRQHARITRDGTRYVIEDLGSGNGTLVNERVIKRHILQNGDEVRICDATFRFEARKERFADSGSGNLVTVIEGAHGADAPVLSTIDAARHTMVSRPPTPSINDLDAVYRKLETIYAIAAAISSTVDLDALLNEIVDHLFRVFPHADRGAIMLLDDETGQVVPRVVRSRRGPEVGQFLISRTIVNEVLTRRRSVLSGAAARDGRLNPLITNVSSHSMIAAPLLYRDQLLGILHMTSADMLHPFGRSDLDMLTGIASQCGIAIGNARMHQELLKQQRLAQDLRFAEQVQRSFLPQRLPDIPGFSFASHYDPAFEVGGDFYDVIDLGDGCIGLLVGDVSGKGVSAALRMARMSTELRFCAMAEAQPAAVMTRANRTLLETSQDEIFVTAVFARLDPRTRILTLSNAGHLPPMIRHTIEGDVTRVEGATGLALGVLAEAVFEQEEHTLMPGDTLLLYTDGLTEAENLTQEQYGFDRLERSLAPGPSDADLLLRRVLTDVRTHVGDAPQYDDLTVVAVGAQRRA